MDESETFVWTFPLFILAGNFLTDASGNPTFHADTYYVAPKADGKHHLAIFTDADLAQTYIERCNPALGLKALACNPGEMLRLLKLAGDRWPGFLIDPSPVGRPSRAAPFSVLIGAIEQHFGIQD
jgi:hypothetical protein